MLSNRIKLVILREASGLSGTHPDPEQGNLHRRHGMKWSRTRRAAFESSEMELFRESLRGASNSVRDAVLEDLGSYHACSSAEVVARAVNWEEESLREWDAADRTDPLALREFYRHTDSWTYDLLWYAYLQAEGHAYPQSVVVAWWLSQRLRTRTHLDLGSGAGATSQLFDALGYETTLADVARPLLDFARFRLERRGVDAQYIDLNEQGLPPDAFDVITALDTLIHVPDISATARELHAAMTPGAYLFAGYEVRRHTERSAYHLYDDDLSLRYGVQRAGFEPVALLDDIIWCYRRVDTQGWLHRLRGVRDWLRLRGPHAVALRGLRRTAAYAAVRVLSRFVPELRAADA